VSLMPAPFNRRAASRAAAVVMLLTWRRRRCHAAFAPASLFLHSAL
jgi:hypothetical protein